MSPQNVRKLHYIQAQKKPRQPEGVAINSLCILSALLAIYRVPITLKSAVLFTLRL